jgi:hypothetical protein
VIKTLSVDKGRCGKESLKAGDGPESGARELAIQEGNKLMQMSDMIDLMDRYSMLVAGQASLSVEKHNGFDSMSNQAPR